MSIEPNNNKFGLVFCMSLFLKISFFFFLFLPLVILFLAFYKSTIP